MALKKAYGLIGRHLKHSFSENYFREKFKTESIKGCQYKLYELSRIEEVKTALPKGIKGFNVTIPYKEQIIPFLDKLDPAAERIGAVNTVKCTDDGWIGYNTDVYGFHNALKDLKGRRKPAAAMVLGNGGAAKAILYVLRNQGIKPSVISRKRGYRGYKNLNKEFISKHELIINTTPLGMYPDVEACPLIPYEFITKRHLLFDLIYNPQKTLFLEKGLSQGASVKNGLEMLELQAEKSWEIWNH